MIKYVYAGSSQSVVAIVLEGDGFAIGYTYLCICAFCHRHKLYILNRLIRVAVIISVHFCFTGVDYDDRVFVRTIPSSTTSHVLSQDIRIYEDNVNEIEQRFALVGMLGGEIPEEFACFQVTFGEAECRGRVGATGIRIRDNDR